MFAELHWIARKVPKEFIEDQEQGEIQVLGWCEHGF